MKKWKALAPMAAVVLTLAAFLGGCASNTAYFSPESGLTTTTTGSGARAAYYVVRINGSDVGTVSIWSRGAYRMGTEAGSPAVLDVRLSIHNDSKSSMMLDPERTDVVIYHGGRMGMTIKDVYQKSGSETVAPGSVAHVKLLYTLPKGIKPGNVDAFDLNWAVSSEGGSFAESTPFIQRYYSSHGYPYNPYYMYGPYWGWWPYWDNNFFFGFDIDRDRFERGREFHGGAQGGGRRGGGGGRRGR